MLYTLVAYCVGNVYFIVIRHMPLENSHQTVLIIGGLQWVTAHHMNTTHHVLNRSVDIQYPHNSDHLRPSDHD